MTDTERHGGSRASSWADWAERQKPTSVRHRPDGLMIRHLPGGRKQWWCRVCDGKRPHFKVAPLTLDEVFAEWDTHRDSEQHLREIRSKNLIDAIAEQIPRHLNAD